MKLDKHKIIQVMAGKRQSSELSEEEKQEALKWLNRLNQGRDRLKDASKNGALDDWIEANTLDDDLHEESESSMALLSSLRDRAGGSDAVALEPISLTDSADEAGRAILRKIADEIYGDETKPFEMILHFQKIQNDLPEIALEIEIAPPPIKKPISLTIGLAEGRNVPLRINVPVSPRPSTRSEASEAIPESLIRNRNGHWVASVWPPLFQFES
jgi:hypothetical protein